MSGQIVSGEAWVPILLLSTWPSNACLNVGVPSPLIVSSDHLGRIRWVIKIRVISLIVLLVEVNLRRNGCETVLLYIWCIIDL